MAERRPLWTVLGLLLLAAFALWLSSRTTWSWSRHTDDVRGTVSVSGTGAQRQAALVPLAVLSLSLVAAVVATSGWPRRALGVVVVLVGVGALAASFDGIGELVGGHPDGYPVAAVGAGHALAAVAGLVVLTAGVLLAVSGHRMPRLGTRYQTPVKAKAAAGADRELWQALDSGQDPTAER